MLTGIKRMTAGYSPRSVDMGDWNGDGKRDMAVLSGEDSLVTIFFGDGQGGFTKSGLYSYHSQGDKLRAGHLDPDGTPDLILGTSGLLVARGRGDGTFHAAPAWTGPKDPEAAATGHSILHCDSWPQERDSR